MAFTFVLAFLVQAVLLATVGIAPFAAPPQELVQLARYSTKIEIEDNLLFGGTKRYRVAYATCWTLSLLLNGMVVLLSTLLLLSLPHLTHVRPLIHMLVSRHCDRQEAESHWLRPWCCSMCCRMLQDFIVKAFA